MNGAHRAGAPSVGKGDMKCHYSSADIAGFSGVFDSELVRNPALPEGQQ
jgi:hypothetical protein